MYTKKLIEVALPLEKINAESAREKSIRHGHPSTLHLWWARRPLATARAVIWSSLVDDPSSHPEQFPTEEAQQKERERLFDILSRLVVWENSNNPLVLEEAKAEIMKSTGNNPPALLDPFAGGGAIPLEAQRLGLEAHAHDLNPVAVMINKAMIEIPPKFANQPPVNPQIREKQMGSEQGEGWTGAAGLAEDVRYYGEWMKKKAFERIGELYPKITDNDGNEYTVIAWIWARTVVSPNPLAHGAYVPLISSQMLSTKKGNKAWVEIVEDSNEKDGWRFEVKSGSISKQEEAIKAYGTKAGKAKDFVCCLTKAPIQREYIQDQGKAGKLSQRLMAIVAQGKNGRVYFSPNGEHEILGINENDTEEANNIRSTFLNGSTPTRAMVTGGVCSAYGLTTWGHLFTGRQLKALTTFSALVKEAQIQAEKDAENSGMFNDHIGIEDNGAGARAYGEAIGIYLGFVVDKLVDYHSSICSWHSSGEKMRNTFGRQALPMVWDYAECNPFCTSSGSYDNMLEWVNKAIKMFPCSNYTGHAKQFDAQSDCGLRSIMISTDPPYYDNIGYADLSDFFYVWMRQTLKDTFPCIFRTMLTPKAEELVATPYRFKGGMAEAKEFFEDGMFNTCVQMHKYAHEDIPVTVYYAFKQNDTNSDDITASSGWETMLSAIIRSGFAITGTWPMRTEMAVRQIASGTNALASSIVLVCRKREETARSVTRREFINALHREMRPALEKLQSANIAPVDLAQSAIGPGIGVFSRYKSVLEADGKPMTVRAALQIINQELDAFYHEQEGEMDSGSRFCVDLFQQFGFNEMAFGEAQVLATAKNTSLQALADRRVLQAAKGRVRLLTREEIPDNINRKEECIWLLTQQLAHRFEKEGVKGCARELAFMYSSNAENAKALAYRLYTVCERKGWAQEGYAYNNLVVSWPEILSMAASIKAEAPEQMAMDLGTL
ncbi:MAG: DUF1156 domain-containing protein [Clostridia bacterium]|nr:DUF1156 domain-containing protein [Clostridia bacterium]